MLFREATARFCTVMLLSSTTVRTITVPSVWLLMPGTFGRNTADELQE